MVTPFPARLHVLLARDAKTGVVLRRGPSKSVCTIGWDRQDDTFTVGQWLHGRIYERRCDLSPDGKYMIYFAMNGKWDSAAKGAWTAISLAPYLKAVLLWPKGDCWNGGGLFTGRRRYWLNGGDCHDPPIGMCRALKPDPTFPWHESYGGECLGVYYIRLQRDGWKLRVSQEPGHQVRFQKPLGDRWTLRKLAHAQMISPPGKGCYFDGHQLVDRDTGTVHEHPTWEWAERDGDRIVWAEEGRLFACPLAELAELVPRLLFDFNDMAFEPLQAPYGA